MSFSFHSVSYRPQLTRPSTNETARDLPALAGPVSSSVTGNGGKCGACITMAITQILTDSCEPLLAERLLYSTNGELGYAFGQIGFNTAPTAFDQKRITTDKLRSYSVAGRPT